MYSLSLLTVDLKIAKERLLSVFEIADSIDSQPKNSGCPRNGIAAWRSGIERSLIHHGFEFPQATEIGVHRGGGR